MIGGGDGGGGGGDGGDGGGSGGDGGSSGDDGLVMSLTVGGSIVAAFLSPIIFGLILMLRDRAGGPPEGSADHGESGH